MPRFYLILTLSLLLWAAACGGSSSSWTGSVDAVFRYRPSESSTVVHEVRQGSMSEESGLKPGDRLIAIDGEDVANADFDTVRSALRGPVGTEARLTVERGGKILQIAVERRPLAKQ